MYPYLNKNYYSLYSFISSVPEKSRMTYSNPSYLKNLTHYLHRNVFDVCMCSYFLTLILYLFVSEIKNDTNRK